MKVGVLASGSGTNLQALLDAQSAGTLEPARIVAVGVNVPGCGAIARAERAGAPVFLCDHKAFPNRAAFEQCLGDELLGRGVECLVMAGFMRIVGESFLQRFPKGVINIHPALLPSFPGVDAQKQAFDHGVKIAGCTVHFVDGGVDSGPIIAQAAVPVLPDDDRESLRLRILAQEHVLLPAMVRAHAEGRVERRGRRVIVAGPEARDAAAVLRST